MKKIICTGATGFLGDALVKSFSNDEITAVGHSEKKTVEKQRENKCSYVIGDILDKKLMDEIIKGDLVIHAAAQKHIPIAEQDPIFSFKNNVIGTINVFQSAIKNKVDSVVFISTDKAHNPETIYGKTKEVGEWLCKYYNGKSKTRFYWCRYGNVGGSSGSVFEIWDELGREGKDLSLTVPDMTRFFFTIDDAVDTVRKTLKKKDTKKPYIPKMKAMRMGDVAKVFSEHYGIKVKIIGNRGSEKIHESLTDKISSKTAKRYTEKEIVKFLKKINLLQ